VAFVRVEFRFPTDTSIAYLEDEPPVGQPVRGLAGEHLVVARVDPDGTGGYIATCVSRSEFARTVARAARAVLEEVGEQVTKLTQRVRDSTRE
jgi:hypothetical protein